MSVEELKAVVDDATDEERLFLAAYLRIKSDDGSLKAALTQACDRVQAGKSVSLEKALELHQELEKLGL
jgi:hypothetical protein